VTKQKSILLIVALMLMAGTAALLTRLGANQRLGQPGVKTVPIKDSRRSEVVLPELVLDYTSTNLPVAQDVLEVLPQDTSFGQRRYQALDGFEALLYVVLMGGDRTSLHKPQICLRGSGWKIDNSEPETVHVNRPFEYDLPVRKLTLSPEKAGIPRRGIYVYWFVADNEYSREHWQRMWWMFRDLLRTGVLQRWSYVTCFATCAPGQEDVTFERMKKFIAAAVPEFQHAPKVPGL
jgi:hypothetical protein